HVVDAVTRLAAPCPLVGFRLEHDGREVLAWPAVRDDRQRLGQVLGRERAASLVDVEAERGGLALRAWLAPPRETVGSARLVWTYVGLGGAYRWTRDRLLLRAVLDGYESLLMHGRYPIAVMLVRFPAGEADVNVHPAKLEVRFRYPAAVHQLIVPTLRSQPAAALRPAAVPPASPVAAPTSYDRPLDGGGFAPEARAATAPSALSSARGRASSPRKGRAVPRSAPPRTRSRRSPATASCGSVSGSIWPRCTRSSRRWTGWTSPRTVRTGAPSR